MLHLRSSKQNLVLWKKRNITGLSKRMDHGKGEGTVRNLIQYNHIGEYKKRSITYNTFAMLRVPSWIWLSLFSAQYHQSKFEWIIDWLTEWLTEWQYVYVKTQSSVWVISPQNHHQFSAAISINLYYDVVLNKQQSLSPFGPKRMFMLTQNTMRDQNLESASDMHFTTRA